MPTPGLKKVALEAFESGIVTMPLHKDKSPMVKGTWNHLKDKPVTAKIIESLRWDEAEGIGYICGKNSGDLFCIDVDVKNDPGDTIATKYKTALNRMAPEWMKGFVIQSTVNNGFHFIGRCSAAVGNLKLASSLDGVILETRGHGGYFAGYPTPGYKIIRGGFSDLRNFTPEEYEVMMALARELDEAPPKTFTRKKMPSEDKIRPGVDYDFQTSIEDFKSQILADGWKQVGRLDQKVYLCRPGKNKGISATFNNPENPGKLFIFSSSTEFPERHGLTPFSYKTYKEFGGDFSECARVLALQGYGCQEEWKKPETAKPKRKTSGLRYLSEMVEEHEEYAKKHKGMKLGIEFIDQITGGLHSELFLLLAEPGSYKTTTLINMLDLYSKRNEGLFGFFSLEMSSNASFKRITQMTTGMTSKEYYNAIRQEKEEWRAAKKQLINNKKLMICGESRLTVTEIAQITKEAQDRTGERVSLIGIDYLDFILASEKTALEKIESIMLSIKAEICDAMNIPVVLLCQTKRDSDSKGVSLRDAKGGTAIEGTADLVLGLYKSNESVFCKWLKHRDPYNPAYAYKTGNVILGADDYHYRIKTIQMCNDFTKGCELDGNPKVQNRFDKYGGRK